jgi:uracil phosphoribosyltransferase
MRDASGQPNTAQMLVFVPPHPLLKHWLAVARSVSTPPQLFRSALAELGRLLIYEVRCPRSLPERTAQLSDPHIT